MSGTRSASVLHEHPHARMPTIVTVETPDGTVLESQAISVSRIGLQLEVNEDAFRRLSARPYPPGNPHCPALLVRGIVPGRGEACPEFELRVWAHPHIARRLGADRFRIGLRFDTIEPTLASRLSNYVRHAAQPGAPA